MRPLGCRAGPMATWAGVVESLKEPIEDLVAADLACVGGVVALPLEDGSELDGGDEEGAGLLQLDSKWQSSSTVRAR